MKQKQSKREVSSVPDSLDGEVIVFTGKLSAMIRDEAIPRAERAGAEINPRRVDDSTSILVLGDLSSKGGFSDKLLEARQRIKDGQRLWIIDEETFLRLVSRKKQPGDRK